MCPTASLLKLMVEMDIDNIVRDKNGVKTGKENYISNVSTAVILNVNENSINVDGCNIGQKCAYTFL